MAVSNSYTCRCCGRPHTQYPSLKLCPACNAWRRRHDVSVEETIELHPHNHPKTRRPRDIPDDQLIAVTIKTRLSGTVKLMLAPGEPLMLRIGSSQDLHAL